MNLNSLRIFHAIATEGSFSRAGKLLFISQPAVSQQLQQLESQFELKLINRLPRGVKLTQEGEILFSYSKRIFSIELECEAKMSSITKNSFGRLAIGASTTIFDYLLPSMLSRYLNKYPKIELQMEVGNTEEICQKISDGIIEIGLLEGTNISSDVETITFGSDEMVVIASLDSSLAELPQPVSKTILKSYPFISREEGSGSQAVVESAIGDINLSLTPLIRLGSTAAIIQSVQSGLGFGIVSSLAAKTAIDSEKLRTISVEGLKMDRELFIGIVPSRQLSVAAKSFISLLNNQV